MTGLDETTARAREGSAIVAGKAGAAKTQHDVELVHCAPTCPEELAQQAPKPIAVHRAGQLPAADHVADAPGRLRSRSEEQLHARRLKATTGTKHPGKLIGTAQSVATRHAALPARAGLQTTSLERPFARREASTLRPPTERILARKPWVRLRLTTEGWNVRFMDPPAGKKPCIRAFCLRPCQGKSWRDGCG